MVSAEVQKILLQELGKVQEKYSESLTKEGFEQVLAEVGRRVGAGEDAQWVAVLATVIRGLWSVRGIPLSEYPPAFEAYEAVEVALEADKKVKEPGKYDRMTQWAFILCLPFAPYCFWVVARTRRQVYRLDEDGTLHLPEGTWKADQIAEIDMSRWMSKSIATVVHHDGTRVELDDYKHHDLHLIIGAIAARRHPEAWTADAKPVKPDQEDESKAEPAADAAGDQTT